MFFSKSQLLLKDTDFSSRLLCVWIEFPFKRDSRHLGPQNRSKSFYLLLFTERTESRLIAQIPISGWKKSKLTSTGKSS